MNKLARLLFALSMLCLCGTAWSQNPTRVTITGSVVDTSNNALPSPTLMLLNPVDSSLINFTRADNQGGFEFKNIKNTTYLLKISYVGFLPKQVVIKPSETEIMDLGKIKIQPITLELMEVVIRTAKAPLTIRGDTIEYDASTFKVPPGSTVEDLLRRLPGIEVDADGNIKAQGRDVRRLYVDGKTFFNDDPKAATKNLGAETISKVQVYNEGSEQSKLTGVDDGKKEKVMNLELKEEFKKGAFGKLTVAYGDQDRWAARGNYNRFNTKEQFSIIGYGNNINQTGVNWDDYGEFKGQSAYNWDDVDFGFSSGRRYFMMDGDGLRNWFDGRGFTQNAGGGLNYNFSQKKAKFNASYTYNQVDLDLNEFGFRQTFLADSSFSNSDTTLRADFRNNHVFNTRYENEIDSSNTIIVKASGRLSQNNSTNSSSQLFSSTNVLQKNRLTLDNDNDLNSWNMGAQAIYRHRFNKKKGRSFSFGGAYQNNNSDGAENIFNINRFFQANTFTDQVRQLNNNVNDLRQVKTSLLYTEPLSKKVFGEVFYNLQNTNNQINRQVRNLESNQRVDELSVFFDNQVTFNRLGTSFRYSHEGVNVGFGLAAQQIRLETAAAQDEGLPNFEAPLVRTFNNVVPNLSANVELKNNMYLGLEYGYQINEPRFNDLQPVRNVNNPAFQTLGNPNLQPERQHNMSFNFNYWNPASFISVNFNSDYNLYDSQIVYTQTIESNPSTGIRTTTRPQNLAGGRSLNSNMWINYPLIKTKLSMRINGGINFGLSPTLINDVANNTNNNGINMSLGLNATPNKKLILDLSANINNQNISYSLREDQNQKIRNYGLDGSVKWNFASKFFLESNLDYNIFRNERLDFKQDVPIWNASVRRLVGKENKFEIRAAAFDLLNRRVTINQGGSLNFVTRNVANTLARYFMLSLSYNIKGYENKLRKNDW
jgi:Outer membrane protein beta-barrel family/Carboxypeptidase regulatory-like domain